MPDKEAPPGGDEHASPADVLCRLQQAVISLQAEQERLHQRIDKLAEANMQLVRIAQSTQREVETLLSTVSEFEQRSNASIEQIRLIQHSETYFTIGEADAPRDGDWAIQLTPQGRGDAHTLGQKLGAEELQRSLFYCSPYIRSKEMMQCLMAGAGTPDLVACVHEDPRLREMSFGTEDIRDQARLRERHGRFYYQYRGGESVAQVFDRVSDFISSLWRHAWEEGKRYVVVFAHGVVNRVFVMRFLGLSVAQYNLLSNPAPSDVITIAPKERISDPQFVSRRWAVAGLRFFKPLPHEVTLPIEAGNGFPGNEVGPTAAHPGRDSPDDPVG